MSSGRKAKAHRSRKPFKSSPRRSTTSSTQRCYRSSGLIRASSPKRPPNAASLPSEEQPERRLAHDGRKPRGEAHPARQGSIERNLLRRSKRGQHKRRDQEEVPQPHEMHRRGERRWTEPPNGYVAFSDGGKPVVCRLGSPDEAARPLRSAAPTSGVAAPDRRRRELVRERRRAAVPRHLPAQR